MSTSKDLRDGIRTLLIAQGVATTGQIFMSRMPTTPDRCLVITVYPVAAEHTTGVQVRARGTAGSTTNAEDWADDIRHALHGLRGLTFGDTGVDTLRWVSGARTGTDANGRDEVVGNFYAVTSDPAASLVDLD